MTDEAYTNLDLDTADQLLIAAGHPDLAKALYHQTQGVRNLVQGEWGTSFVNSLEGLLIKYIHPLSSDISGLRTEVAARLGKLSEDVGDLSLRMTALETRMDDSQIDRQNIHDEVAALRTELRAYVASNKRDEFARRLVALEKR